MIDIIIKIIHLIIVIGIAISPFIDNLTFKKNILTLLVFLLFQYLSGYERCGLTELEYLFMGEKYKEGFIYRIINPIIKIPEAYFDKCLIIIHVIYTIILYLQIY
jgi:hypothetical protein